MCGFFLHNALRRSWLHVLDKVISHLTFDDAVERNMTSAQWFVNCMADLVADVATKNDRFSY